MYCYVCRPEKLKDGPESMSSPPPEEGPRPDGEMTLAVRAELERVGAAGSIGGVGAIKLARALDDPAIGNAQLTSLLAQLAKVMEPLVAAGPAPKTAADAWRERVEAKQRAAS